MRVVEEDGSIIYVGYIYRHWIISDNGIEKSYIGKTIHSPYARWGKNGKGYKTKYFVDAIEKYGWDNFHHDILITIKCDSSFDLDFWLASWEEYFFEKYDSTNNERGYNICDKSIFQDEYMRYKMGNGSRNKPKTEEQRKKMSDSHKGKKVSQETRLKLSNTRKERGLSKGEKNPFYGEHLWGSSNRNAKKVICLNTGQVFDTIQDAQKWAGQRIDSGISKCCHKRQKTSGKHPVTGEPLRWMFYNEYLKLKEEDDN